MSQRFDNLYGVNFSNDFSKNRRLISRAGADFQNPVCRLQARAFGHQGNNIGLGNGLVFFDGKRPVGVGNVPLVLFYKLVAGNFQHRL